MRPSSFFSRATARDRCAPLVLLALAFGCDPSTSVRCENAGDCNGGRVCVQKLCVLVAPADDAAADQVVVDDAAADGDADAAGDAGDDPDVAADAAAPPAGADAGPDAPADAAAMVDTAAPDAEADAGAPDAGPPAGRFGVGDGVKRAWEGLASGFWGPIQLGGGAPCVTSQYAYSAEFYMIDASDGSILRASWKGGDWNDWTTNLTPSALGLRDGVDAVYSDLRHIHLVSRAGDGTLRYYWYDHGAFNPEWHQEPLGDGGGVFRPAIAHLGPGNVVVFQVRPDRRGLVYRRLRDGVWGTWIDGEALELTAGLDALTTRLGDGGYRVQVASRDASNRPIIAAFDDATGAMAPFAVLEGAPPGGVAEAPALASFGLAAGQIDVLVVAADRSLWKRSFDGVEEDVAFVPVQNSPDKDYGAIEATTGEYSGDRMGLALVRQNFTDRRIQLINLGISPR